ncbi:MAG TPA: hypothetical protein VF524_13040 [Polyangia bacterium]
MRKTLVLIGPLALLACGNQGFNTPQLLKTPRVLAIQAEPPQPSVGTSTTLRALIYLPPVHSDTAECAGVDPAAKYQWSWCLVPTSSGDGYQCHIQQAEVDALAQQLGLAQTPQLDPATGEIDLGTSETATLINPFPAQILDGICTGAINLSPRPDTGTSSATPDGGWIVQRSALLRSLAETPITSVGRSRLRGSLAAVRLGRHWSGASFISI